MRIEVNSIRSSCALVSNSRNSEHYEQSKIPNGITEQIAILFHAKLSTPEILTSNLLLAEIIVDIELSIANRVTIGWTW